MATKILVVDDEPYMHRLLHHHFGRAGFQTLDAVNGRQAVEIAQRESPGLIVMDVMMAEMDGLSALKQLKKDDATKAIPVIMITASAHHITRQEAEQSGAALFLTKPFSPTKLLMAVRDLMPEAPRA
jgi:CheY-like chemotaxis protein